MDEQARLMRALAAARPPLRDGAFVVAVMERAEAARFQVAAARAVLRGGALAAAAAACLLPLSTWAGSHADGFQNGLLGAASLAVLVGAMRVLTYQVTAGRAA